MHDHNYDMWSKLYGGDGVHPSPHGTLVLVCVLYVTITNEAPPRYDEQWWSFTNRGGGGGRRRRVAPRRRQLPTKEEGEEIRKNVCEALGCNIDDES
mmetsp:Transcript_10116/g.14538  ORF Transcript_10116/g.14538 Transcript_10116/m.14538 type:complete len:97 (-) Transcript_10116:47-337(-)